MGKNLKEKYSYCYLHDIRDVPYKILIKLFKKWRRHNFDIGTFRHERNLKMEKIYYKELRNADYE